MKMRSLFVVTIASLFLLIGCGKPSDPDSLTPDDGGYKIIKKFVTSGYAQDVIIKDNLLYIAQGEGGLMIVDVTDPVNPEEVSTLTKGVRGYSTKISMKDSIVYLAAGSFGISVVDVKDPAEPYTTVSNLNMKPAKNLHIMGDWIFTAVSEQGVNIADVSVPGWPDIRGGLYTSGYAMDMVTTSDSAYLLVASGEMGLSMYDISNFEQGYGVYRKVGWGDTPGYAESLALLEEESIAFMACGTSGLQVVNYADTNNIRVIGSYDGGGYAKEILYDNNKVFLTVEMGGLQIIDVSNPSSPSIIGQVDSEFSLGLTMDEDYVYMADEDEGLIVIRKP